VTASRGLPKGWSATSLGDIAFITKLAGFEYTEHFDYSVSGEVVVIRGLNIKNGSLNLDDVHTIPRDTSNSLPRSKLAKDDIVMGYVGTIGDAALIQEDDMFHLAPNVAKITPSKEQVYPRYLHVFMHGDHFQNELRLMTSTSSQPAMSMGSLRKTAVILPPLEEQRKIADILSTWDEAIEQQTRLLEMKRERKRGLMQQLLTGKVRFKEFEGLEWTTVELGSLLSHLGNGLTYDTRQTAGAKVTRIETISAGTVNASKVGYTTYTEELERYRLRQGDILYSHINSLSHIGKVAYFDSGEVLYHGMNLLLLRANEKTSSKYLFYLLTSRQARKQALANAKSAVNQASINTTELRKFTFSLPSLSEQRKIAAVLSAADTELETLEKQLTALRTQKRGLMQQLLTGKTRVSLS
jgi:type I restriction enzyme S subunit